MFGSPVSLKKLDLFWAVTTEITKTSEQATLFPDKYWASRALSPYSSPSSRDSGASPSRRRGLQPVGVGPCIQVPTNLRCLRNCACNSSDHRRVEHCLRPRHMPRRCRDVGLRRPLASSLRQWSCLPAWDQVREPQGQDARTSWCATNDNATFFGVKMTPVRRFDLPS